MSPAELFKQYGALHLKDVVSKDLRQFLTHILLRSPFVGYGKTNGSDLQVPGSAASVDHEVVFETLQEQLWPLVEEAVGFELLPTYSYARLYQNGNVLEKHIDRPACEISITVQLGRSHHYAWPIFMGNKRYDLAEGDGVIYRGCDVEHWRDACNGPDGYYSGQVFLHFVDANGKNKSEVGDSSNRKLASNFYVKHRQYQMENK
jgi:hypothetical protein